MLIKNQLSLVNKTEQVLHESLQNRAQYLENLMYSKVQHNTIQYNILLFQS